MNTPPPQSLAGELLETEGKLEAGKGPWVPRGVSLQDELALGTQGQQQE